jgi:hypothetical protein
MSIRRQVLEQLTFEPYIRSTQFVDLMLQKPNGTQQLGCQQCGKNVKLIAIGDLKESSVGLIRKKLKQLTDKEGQTYQSFNYRGYPIAIKFDGPIRSDFFLILVSEPENHIELLKVTKPTLGLTNEI